MIKFLTCILILLANLSYADDSTYSNPTPSRSGINPDTERSVTISAFSIENGLGSENREKTVKAIALINQRKFGEAGVLLDDVIKAFETNYIKNGMVFVSLEDKAAFDRYRISSGKVDAVWLDYSYREAYFFKAFIATEQNRHETALQVLDKIISTISPNDPGALCEKGNIYNITGRASEGLKQYLQAYEITKEVPSSKHFTATALRGMGFSYIELGKLQEAEEAYTESLKLDPGSSVAAKELRYINSIKSRMQNK
jgi:tetratricopeptide (TPR) repeat protein